MSGEDLFDCPSCGVLFQSCDVLPCEKCNYRRCNTCWSSGDKKCVVCNRPRTNQEIREGEHGGDGRFEIYHEEPCKWCHPNV